MNDDQSRDVRALCTRHLRFAWWSLLCFVILGITLEALHAFKIGWSVEANLAAANAELRKAAEGNLVLAQTALGMLRLNEGDWPEAAMWLRRAVEQDDPQAMHSLAYIYENGLSVPRDLNEAARLYERALARGFGSKENLARVRRMLAGEGGR